MENADADGAVYSYFGTQQGDFRLELKSISARKSSEEDAANVRKGGGMEEVGGVNGDERAII